MERNGLRFETFAQKDVKFPPQKKFFTDFFHLFTPFKRLFAPLHKVQFPNFFDFRNLLGNVMERNGLRY